MKKIFALLAVALCIALPSSAQLRFGVKAGLNLAGKPTNISSQTAMDKDNYTGFFAGGMAKLTIPIIGLGVEGDLLYSQSGTEINGEKATKRAIDIPVSLRYDFALPLISKIAVPFVAVGPQFSFNFSDDDLTFNDLGSKYQFKKSALSLNLGVGCILLSHLQAHVNYNLPLGNTAEYKHPDTDAIKDVVDGSKISTWQVSLAYLF